MNVGKIISGSQLLQRVESIQASASAEERSSDQSIKIEASNSVTHSQAEQYGSQETLKKEQVEELAEALNKFMKPVNSAIRFEFHEKLQEYYVTIIDSSTNEVIKEVPPKKMLDMYASMAELLGFIVDEKM